MRVLQLLAAMLVLAISFNSYASTVTYRLTVTNDWLRSTHPIGYPDDAHFSWLGGGTHANPENFWRLGGTATSGFERLAETGVTTEFVNEIQSAGGTGLEWRHWFCPPGQTNSNCGSLSVTFQASSDKPFLTLASMLGPSPDWFVGVHDLNLRSGGSWRSSITVPLLLLDGGTEEGKTPILDNPATSPFAPISYLSYDPSTGEYIGSISGYSIGQIKLTLVPLPAALWLFVSSIGGLILVRRKRLQKQVA